MYRLPKTGFAKYLGSMHLFSKTRSHLEIEMSELPFPFSKVVTYLQVSLPVLLIIK